MEIHYDASRRKYTVRWTGAGSSGFVELDGWGCAGALGTDQSYVGSCQRIDKPAGFTVVAS